MFWSQWRCSISHAPGNSGNLILAHQPQRQQASKYHFPENRNREELLIWCSCRIHQTYLFSHCGRLDGRLSRFKAMCKKKLDNKQNAEKSSYMATFSLSYEQAADMLLNIFYISLVHTKFMNIFYIKQRAFTYPEEFSI